jgi:hypothetical protein
VGDVSPAVDEHADLAPDVPADLGELAGELVGDEAIGPQAASVEALDGADLAGLQPMGVAEDLDTATPLGSRERRPLGATPGCACPGGGAEALPG